MLFELNFFVPGKMFEYGGVFILPMFTLSGVHCKLITEIRTVNQEGPVYFIISKLIIVRTIDNSTTFNLLVIMVLS